MHVNHDVEAAAPQPPGQPEIVREPRHAARPLDDQHLVEMWIAGDHRGRVPLDKVGDSCGRKRPLQRPQHRRRQHHIADQPQADQEDVHGSRFDGRLVQQHAWNIVLDVKHAVALGAFQGGAVLDEVNLRLAVRARENLDAAQGRQASIWLRGHAERCVRDRRGIIVTKMRRTAFCSWCRASRFRPAAAAQSRSCRSRPGAAITSCSPAARSGGGRREGDGGAAPGLTLAPKSAELRAELAAVYARQKKAVEAIEAADEALKSTRRTAKPTHRGSIYAALPSSGAPSAPARTRRSNVRRAIAALQRARENAAPRPGSSSAGPLYVQTDRSTRRYRCSAAWRSNSQAIRTVAILRPPLKRAGSHRRRHREAAACPGREPQILPRLRDARGA